MRPLKIALLSRWYAEEHRRLAGAGAVQQLAEAVAALGHDVVVLSQSKAAATLEKSRVGTLETWLSPREKRRGGWTGLRDKLAKRRYGHRKVFTDARVLGEFLAARGPFDALWCQCEEPDGLVAAIAAREGIALPPTLTQIFALRYRFENRARVPEGHAALHAAFLHAARVIANSELVAGELRPYCGPGLTPEQLAAKTWVVYPNLQTALLDAARQAGPAAEPGRVLFLGALNETKGATVFLDAARALASLPNAVFAVAGATTEENPAFDRAWSCQLAAARGAGAKIELLGRLSGAEVVTEVRRASLVVLPSLFDGFSRALVEALVLERPVVTTETVGAATLVRNAQAGLVVPPGDAAALAEGIRHVLGNLALFSDNARQAAARLAHELSPHAIALQIARHLSEMVEANHE